MINFYTWKNVEYKLKSNYNNRKGTIPVIYDPIEN